MSRSTHSSITGLTSTPDPWGAFASPRWTEDEALERQKLLYVAGHIGLRKLEERVGMVTQYYDERRP